MISARIPSDAMCDAAEAASKEVPRSTVSLREWWRFVLRAAQAVDADAVVAARVAAVSERLKLSTALDVVGDCYSRLLDGVTPDDAPPEIDNLPPCNAWVEGYEAGQNSVCEPQQAALKAVVIQP